MYEPIRIDLATMKVLPADPEAPTEKEAARGWSSRKYGPRSRPVVAWPSIKGKRGGRKLTVIATLNGLAVNIQHVHGSVSAAEGKGGTGIELSKDGVRELHRQLGEYIAQEGAE